MTMMKMKTFYWAALAAAVLAGCSNDDEPGLGPLPQDGAIRVTAQVSQLTETRAEESTTTPYGGTTLGLYIRPTATTVWDNTQDKYTYPNVKFTNTDGTWTQSEYTMLWKGEDVDYEYYAYAPADTKADSDHKVAYDLSKQAAQTETENDLLWASAKGKASDLVTNQALAITFDHALCQVAVKITLGDEFYQGSDTDNPIKDINISTTRLSGTMNVLTGTLTADADAKGTLPFTVAKGTHVAGTDTTNGTYTSPYIFYAPGSETFTVTITTTTGRTFVYTHPEAYTFESGHRYLVTLSMGKEVLRLGGIDAADWEKGTGGTLETE